MSRARLRWWLAVTVVALIGAGVGVVVGGAVERPVGPVQARLSVRPGLSGDTRVDVAPLGSLRLDTHDGPFRLNVEVTELRPASARQIFDDPASLDGVGARVQHDLGAALRLLVLRCLLAAAVGAAVLGLLVFRRWRPTLAAVCVGLTVVGAGGAAARLTWRPGALAEPQYSGLLASAPAAIGDARDIVSRFGVYRKQLAALVTDVSQLYDVSSTLPVQAPDPTAIRALHISDLHLNPAGWDVVESLVRQFRIDVVVDTGDIADHGSAAENRFVTEIGRIGVPYVYVRGNHDSAGTAAAVRAQRGAVVLDGTAATVAGLRFFGVGDPRFTPDKSTGDDAVGEPSLTAAGARARLALLGTEPPNVDVAMTHDPVMARPLAGAAPLLLAGHTHHRDTVDLDGSLLLVSGSTGGAGLRGLEPTNPTSLECSVLYFDRSTRRLQAYDAVTVGGLGLASVQISRHVVGSGAALGASDRFGRPTIVP